MCVWSGGQETMCCAMEQAHICRGMEGQGPLPDFLRPLCHFRFLVQGWNGLCKAKLPASEREAVPGPSRWLDFFKSHLEGRGGQGPREWGSSTHSYGDLGPVLLSV